MPNLSLNQQFLRYIVNADLASIDITLEENPDFANQKAAFENSTLNNESFLLDSIQLAAYGYNLPPLKNEYFLIHAIQLLSFSSYIEGNYPPNKNKFFEAKLKSGFVNKCELGLSLVNKHIYKIQSTAQYEKVIECLIKHGANIDCVSKLGYSAVQLAAQISSPRIIELMLTKNPDMRGEKNPLNNSLVANNKMVTQLLVKAGADTCYVDSDGESLLFRAVLITGPDVVEILVQNKAPIDLVNKDGLTVCMLAVCLGTDGLDIFKKLLPANPDLSIKDNEGKTVYDYINEGEDAEEFLTAIKEYKDNHELVQGVKININ